MDSLPAPIAIEVDRDRQGPKLPSHPCLQAEGPLPFSIFPIGGEESEDSTDFEIR